jgi:selenocysteine lyase/cysteine desulfurase
MSVSLSRSAQPSSASAVEAASTNAQGEPDRAYWQGIQANIIEDRQNPDRLYADWTASGRLYRPIEQRISELAGQIMANTHTEDSYTGREMSRYLAQAHERIKAHVRADSSDVLLNVGTGMTGALAKLMRLLGWWSHESHRQLILDNLAERPLVYITHREHHSNQTMWLESLAELRLIPALDGDDIDLAWLEQDLLREAKRKIKVASVTAASNVTGIVTPYRDIARLMHAQGGLAFVDFAASAPYVDIDMHPNADEWLDAIYFSPHKFLGGPGSNGVLVFNQALYQNRIPDQPGGGTVLWTNPWGEHRFIKDIEQRESGGTPGILQTLRTALAIQLKEEMGTERIAAREAWLNQRLFARLSAMPAVRVLSDQHRDRLSVFSIVFANLDYRSAVQRLSDRFYIESRGGCACAGTYGHHLLAIDQCTSNAITAGLDEACPTDKPGWVRISLHPSMSVAQLDRLADAIGAVAQLSVDQTPLPRTPAADFWTTLS